MPKGKRLLTVRPETPKDIDAIRAVHEAAFPSPAEAMLVDRLRSAGHLRVSLVAIENEIVVGPLNFQAGGGLAPLAVTPAHQRKGAGKALVNAAIDACRNDGFGFIVVLGDPEYYSRFGFVPAATYNLIDEYAGGDAFQVLVLREKQLPSAGSLTTYAPEFAGLA